MHDLAVIVISTNEAHWLRPCLGSVFERSGALSLDVVVADNSSTDGTRELVEEEFPQARVVTCENRGFAHANNRGAETCNARYVLFLNPDTEIVDGTLAGLVQELDAQPTVGLAGVKQVDADGNLHPTMRSFPNAVRAFGDAFGLERLPWRPRVLGERELDLTLYDRETACDWTIGSFMLVRREALQKAGLMDERFFIYSEEVDLCLRIRQAGFEIRHFPTLTIIHHVGKGGTARSINERMVRQNAFAGLQYARKHFCAPHREVFRVALLARYLIRASSPRSDERAKQRRAASLAAARVLVGRSEPPFGAPPPTA